MRLEQGAVHLIEFPVLPCELGGAQGAARVDDDVALLHRQANLAGNGLEMRAHLVETATAEIDVHRDALDRRFRVQLKRKPRHPDEILLLQLFNSDRVDVAPGSNVIGEDDELDRFGCVSHVLMHNPESRYAIPGPRASALPSRPISGLSPGVSQVAGPADNADNQMGLPVAEGSRRT